MPKSPRKFREVAKRLREHDVRFEIYVIEGSGGEERPTISLGPGAVYASGRF